MNTKHPALTLPLNDTTSTSFHINILLLLLVVFMSKRKTFITDPVEILQVLL